MAVALAAASCARLQQITAIDRAGGEPVASSASDDGRGLFSSQNTARLHYAQQDDQQPVAQAPASEGRGLLAWLTDGPAQSAQPNDQQPVPSGRGWFNARASASQAYAPPPVQAPAVVQYGMPQNDQRPPVAQAPASEGRGLLSSQSFRRPQYAQQTYQQPVPSGRGLFNSTAGAPQYAAPQYVTPQAAAAPYGYASAAPYDAPYTLDAGDKLRVIVFGQDGISNTYLVDAGGNVNLPLVGTVLARGATARQLSQRIAERLKQGYVREPHVTVEVETNRPFFILGEVTNPGQYPYVADMTVEKAIAIAGGFAPRASKTNVEVTRDAPGQQFKAAVPLSYPLRPGDTVLVKERWF